MNVQFKKGALELIVLLIIKKEDQYGYSLVQNISNQLEEDWKLFTEAVEHFIEESENE